MLMMDVHISKNGDWPTYNYFTCDHEHMCATQLLESGEQLWFLLLTLIYHIRTLPSFYPTYIFVTPMMVRSTLSVILIGIIKY